MHWRTFERLQREHDSHLNVSLAGIGVKLGILRGRLGKIDADMDL